MNQYKDTTQQPNTLETLKTAQNDNRTKVTLLDMVKSILLAVLIIALLLFITTLQQAHPKNSLLLVADMMDNKDLSKLSSDTPNRYPLAFFMPNYRLTSQVNDINSIAPLTHFTGLNRHKFMPVLAAVYVRKDIAKYKSLLGEYAGRLLLRPRVISEHPMISHSVNLTHNLVGGYHA